jgi:uncharacterized protein YbcI
LEQVIGGVMPNEKNAHSTESPALAISNAITRMHRDHYGRGAANSRTVIQGDYVVTFMRDIYTPVERTLLEAGADEAVKNTRQIFHQAMRQSFVDAVEQVMGRKVIAFMSQVHMNPDMAAEIFVLEPEHGQAPSLDGASSG